MILVMLDELGFAQQCASRFDPEQPTLSAERASLWRPLPLRIADITVRLEPEGFHARYTHQCEM